MKPGSSVGMARPWNPSPVFRGVALDRAAANRGRDDWAGASATRGDDAGVIRRLTHVGNDNS